LKVDKVFASLYKNQQVSANLGLVDSKSEKKGVLPQFSLKSLSSFRENAHIALSSD